MTTLAERIPENLPPSCWTKIGVWGDTTCPALTEVVHCRNCPVYTEAGRSLLGAAAPAGYLAEWSTFLAGHRDETVGDTQSVVLFRLAEEWLALPAGIFKEATEMRPMHRVPHRTNSVLAGLVNVRGELLLCFSLAALVGIEAASGTDPGAALKLGSRVYRRLVVVTHENQAWVFPVDELHAVVAIPTADFEAVPPTVGKASASFTKKIFRYQDRDVGLLDGELVFFHLRKNFL